MSRTRRAVHGVASSYVLLAATAFYALASVPLALHYLDTKRFGLWIVIGSLAGYLNLVDAGMTSAASRLLIDYKDNRNGGPYGGFIKTSWLIFLLQGTVIFAIGLFLADTFARLLGIDPDLCPEFIQLVNWQCGAVALSFATRIFALVLNGHQRMDLANYVGVGALLLNFVIQWILFHCAFGVMSLALGSLIVTAVTAGVQAVICLRLKVLPDPGKWGAISWRHFLEIANFGKDVFLVALGTQMISASQTIIITRMLGLQAAAVWGIGLRAFNLLNQVIWRFSDMSSAAFAEMMARGEMDRLRDRYRSLAMFTFSLAGWMAISFALCNSLFISGWTRGKIYWPPGNDVFLAIWMILSAVVHCHNGFALQTKRVGFMRYIYFLEGSIFVLCSFLIIRWVGMLGLIICSIVCTSALSFTYGIFRISRYFNTPVLEVAFGWLRPMLKVILFYLPAACLCWWLTTPASAPARLAVYASLASTV
ncbi:MAG TPA: MATE family efflux transporter, partial [Candidatus Acidoferrum sp.]|nr:MATE family efflux transporter [Candidatus Acidoferrum sp.]